MLRREIGRSGKASTRTSRTRTRTGSQSRLRPIARSGQGRGSGHCARVAASVIITIAIIINQSINQSFNPSSSLLSPALSFHIPFKLAGPGRCGTDPARFKLSLFPDRHQVISRQTAAVETKTPKRRTTDRNTVIELHLRWLLLTTFVLAIHTVLGTPPTPTYHTQHTTHHTTAQIRSQYLAFSREKEHLYSTKGPLDRDSAASLVCSRIHMT